MNYRVALLLKNIFSLKPKLIYDYFIRGNQKIWLLLKDWHSAVTIQMYILTKSPLIILSPREERGGGGGERPIDILSSPWFITLQTRESESKKPGWVDLRLFILLYSSYHMDLKFSVWDGEKILRGVNLKINFKEGRLYTKYQNPNTVGGGGEL